MECKKQKTLENMEGEKDGQSKETCNTWYTRRRQTKQKQTKQKHNTVCVGYHHTQHKQTQTNTNNVNKTWTLLQTTGGKDETNKNKQRK